MTQPDTLQPEPRVSFVRQHSESLGALTVFVLTVALTVLSFPPSPVPEAAYVFAAPAIFWAYLRPSRRLYIRTVLGAQAVAWMILFAWLRHVAWGGWFLPGPVLLGGFIGAWVGSWFLAVRVVMPRILGRSSPERILALLGLAGAWVVVEWTRTWLLSGFPWLPLSASQWERVSILQISAYTGAWGVSFVLVMANLGFAAYAHRLLREGRTGFAKRSQEFLVAMFLLLVCLAIHVQETFNRGRFAAPAAKFAIVQPHIAQSVKWDESAGPAILRVLAEETLRAAATEPDVILWPEATTPWAVRGDPGVAKWTAGLVARAGAPLVLGSIAIEDEKTPAEAWYNGVFAVDPEGGVREAYYAKRKLVPFGEFVPFRPVLGWIGKFVPVGGDFMHGTQSAPIVITPRNGEPLALGTLICYEDIFPALGRASVRAGADVLTVHTNNGWFGEGGAAFQHAAHSVLRAVELRRPMIRAGNSGWSGWIDEFGNVRQVLTRDGGIYFRGGETIAVTTDRRWTGRLSFYAQHGDWFVALSAALAAAAALRFRRPDPR